MLDQYNITYDQLNDSAHREENTTVREMFTMASYHVVMCNILYVAEI